MKQAQAFTLVELSIVLVILGLLIGGVLTGQSLIRAAELRSVSTQINQYLTATQTFRDKYFALPGDMPNAQSYWGVAHATPATCVTTSSTTALTCNGNGDGLISLSAGSNESFRFWQHLANAGLIEGTYDGITHGSNSWSASIENSPPGKLSSSLWSIANIGTLSGQPHAFDGFYGNSFAIGGNNPNNSPTISIFKPEEAYNIDMKVDDGKPATGKVVLFASAGFAGCTDASASTTLTANYLLSGTAKSCVLYFRNAF